MDTTTGEISRRRVAPADRAGVREFVSRFSDQELEVALEATTGWRFVAEELRTCSKPPNVPDGAPHPTTSTTSRPHSG